MKFYPNFVLIFPKFVFSPILMYWICLFFVFVACCFFTWALDYKWHLLVSIHFHSTCKTAHPLMHIKVQPSRLLSPTGCTSVTSSAVYITVWLFPFLTICCNISLWPYMLMNCFFSLYILVLNCTDELKLKAWLKYINNNTRWKFLRSQALAFPWYSMFKNGFRFYLPILKFTYCVNYQALCHWHQAFFFL